jgi:hypothetical protein
MKGYANDSNFAELTSKESLSFSVSNVRLRLVNIHAIKEPGAYNPVRVASQDSFGWCWRGRIETEMRDKTIKQSGGG